MKREEKLLSVIISIVFILGIIAISSIYKFDINYHKASELFINAFSIIVGFLLTVGTLLHTISNDKINFIRKSGKEDILYLELREAIYFGLIAVISSIVYSLFDEAKWNGNYLGGTILFINIIAFFRCFYFIKFFFKMIVK